MKPFAHADACARLRRAEGQFQISGDADDFTLARKMREAAVALHTDGRCALRLSHNALARLRRACAQAESLAARVQACGAVEQVARDARLMEACAQQARADAVRDLPGRRGAPRVLRMLGALCGRGELRLTEERLMLAVASFDEVQPLEMAELWAVPQAMRVCLSHAYVRVAEQAVRMAKERERAQRWAQDGCGNLRGRAPAFFEHALRLLSEAEDAARCAKLERFLLDAGTSSEQIVQQAHSMEASLRLRMENIAANRRLIDDMDWARCFEALSAVENELMYDAVYASMEEDSRGAVRAQVAVLARRLGLSELTVARHAVHAAQTAERGADDCAKHTVCYWLYDDAGRAALAARMQERRVRLPRMIPDPGGRRAAWGLAVAAMAGYLLYLKAVDGIWFAALGIPLAWSAATAVVGRAYSRFVRPAKLLKLEMNHVPDSMRTLVTMPVLLSSEERARSVCAQMEALGCLEKDENLSFLLLGDFADADQEHLPDDDKIVNAVRSEIKEMNARARREKYYYLQRDRRLLEADGRWMGRDRKRGALMALNRLLLGENDAQRAFDAEGSACEALKNRYRYVLTIDADTRFLPGAARRLIGTLAHPLNAQRVVNGVRRGYAVLQPRMELAPDACGNAFVRLFAGNGGLDTYPTAVSDFWQDVTGTGVFGGKGLYDVRAFNEALDGALPEGRILSHDLIEGALAGAAQVNDVCFFDGYPATLGGVLRRRNRWTRGDWQLLPELFSMRRFPPDGQRLGMADRTRMLGNLLRSLRAPALLALLVQAIWFRSEAALAVGLTMAYLAPILHVFRGGMRQWRRATAELMLLPAMAACDMDAVLRTLWRLAVTGRRLLDWVTSADSEGSLGGAAVSCRVTAILLLPGLLSARWFPAAAGLGMLFAIAPERMRDLEQTLLDVPPELTSAQRRALTNLARDTWGFFEKYVTQSCSWLPPDNVQVDPDVGAARRTSPTNIGLYMTCCIAARELGFISASEAKARLDATVSSLERMEKWRGHLYNWYEVDALKPLNPKYVSSVDSGNLAAALLLCAASVGDGELAHRMQALVEHMDFAALYNERRGLFAVGLDVQSDRLSESHYDLLASESRILSYVAMMLGQAPLKHWSKLSRATVSVQRRAALLSWSGTMFEYLMPELFMHAPENTLLGGAMRAAIDAQRALGQRKGRPWGVSESGYYAFDLALNYQYRAFGLRELALGEGSPEDVVAPYASMLAVFARPKDACDNLDEMTSLGWRGEYGLYEAADYLRTSADGAPRLVRSYMAHHQGMILCALCNALTDRALSRAFMRIPQARALELLLQEKSASAVRLGRRSEAPIQKPNVRMRDERIAHPEKRLVDVHLLGGAGTTVLVTADGAVHYVRKDVEATRFDGDFLNREDGACVHLRLERAGECAVAAGKVRYEPGLVTMHGAVGRVEYTVSMCVSPEDGALLKHVRIANLGEETERVTITDCAPAALGRAADMRAHPAFQNLFVIAERVAQCAVALRRRPRGEETYPTLVHLASTPGTIGCETSMERLVGREGSTMRPGGISHVLTGRAGSVLNPCTALEKVLNVAPGESAEMHFAYGLTEEEDMRRWIERNLAETAPERAAQLASMQARAMLGFLGLAPGQAHLAHRFSALLLDGRLAAGARMHRGQAEPIERETLWSMGISGELPIIVVYARRAAPNGCVRDALRAHEFYRTLGVHLDLVLIDESDAGYDRPVRDALTELIALSPLNDRIGTPGGVFLLEKQALDEVRRETLSRASVLEVSADEDFFVQVRRALVSIEIPRRLYVPMNVGRSKLEPMNAPNGWGMFLSDGRFAIDVLPGRAAPAPWSNVLACDGFGALLTERGGGYLWGGNSRADRLTAFANDTLHEGWGWMLYLVEEDTGACLPLLPGARPQTAYRAIYAAAETAYRFEAERASGELAMCVDEDAAQLRIHATVRAAEGGRYRIVGFVDWLMGTDAKDAGFVRTWTRDGACFAAGTARGVGYFAASSARAFSGCDRNAFLGHGNISEPEGVGRQDLRAGGWTLNVPLTLSPGVPARTDWVIGLAAGAVMARRCVRAFYAQPDYESARGRTLARWEKRLGALRVETPDAALNHMMNQWLVHQTLSCRVRARTGLYQPGGAYGFRDQLQDMLALLPSEPERVREHLLRCAARQFEDGDVMHWWHEPYLGVRTNIRDDMLFLPYVAAKYVAYTGDSGVFAEKTAYLKNVEIEAGREDRFCQMQPSEISETLHEHCMRAFRRAADTGVHGLVKMGGGDWNDGMNRVGAKGRGESVWLTMFLSACARDYAVCAPDADDRAWLCALSDRLAAAVEANGWDGRWYLRAYTDDGEPLGGAACQECAIDLISQAWAVQAGLDAARCHEAMDEAWARLADEDARALRLLDPPFEGAFDPGYIQSYPAGVRENGGQYTHGVCWALLAWIRMGDGMRAHRALKLLLPMNHADTPERAQRYRVEPYVMAADIYAGEHAGRGGWTWYTGSSAWMYVCVLALLGYERQGNRVRLRALLDHWPEAAVTVRFGASSWRLVCRADCKKIALDGADFDGEWIEMIDDGCAHEAVFPPRPEGDWPEERPMARRVQERREKTHGATDQSRQEMV